MDTFNCFEKTLVNSPKKKKKNKIPQGTNIYKINTNIFCNHRLGFFEMLIVYASYRGYRNT